MLRGVPVREAARRELRKQTGIVAEFQVRGTCRVIDRTASGSILEDKLFTLLVAEVPQQITPTYWYGGESVWLTREELLAKTPLFPTTEMTLELLETGGQFAEITCTYTPDEY